jgi:tetratricopeptide (TPR) repeat protein
LFLFSLALSAQTLPELPRVAFDEFGPAIREQVRKAYAAAQAEPRDAEANGRLGMMLHSYGQYELAALCYARARSFAPEDFRWMYYAGVVQAALGHHREAVAAFKEGLRQRPDDVSAQLRLADSLLAAGQLSEGRQFYEAMVKTNARIAQAHYGLGRIIVARSELTAGVEHFRRALDSFPDYGAAHYALGLALRDLGQTAKAQEHLALSQKHMSSRPSLADPLLEAVAELNLSASERLKRGIVLEEAGQIELSIAEHERAVELDPKLAQAHINLISLYGRMGRVEKAEQHYRAAVAISPNLADGHYNFGVLLVGQERYEEAARAFERSLQLNPFHAESHFNYGVMMERDGRLEEAAEHYRRAIENQPGYRLAHFHLGRILVHQGRLTDAIEHFLRTLTPEDNETPRFVYALGATYARAGDKQKAIHYLREALKRAQALGQTQLVTSIERDLRTLERGVDK